ncbi:MAG: hypothetical protein KBF68_08930 [Nitrosomonas sp.]|nr:hypothetical protein [Nitrosomonas sp.]
MTDNEKIEIARIATQLTITILEKRGGDITTILTAASKEGSNVKTPDVFAIFDASYKHVQETLGTQ